MAREIFITEGLSNDMLLAGDTLIKRLDASGAEVGAAFWLQDGVEKLWEFTLVSPFVDLDGPRNFYKKINDINESLQSDELMISLHDIRVSGCNNRIVTALKNSVLGNAILGNNRLGRNRIGHVYIEDMYIYRMDWALLSNAPVEKCPSDQNVSLCP